MSAYDPRARGADCGACPLLGSRVVPPDFSRENIGLLVVAEAPGAIEVDLGRPLVGPSGGEMERALVAAGSKRSDVNMSNALLCRPPRNDLKGYMARLRRENKERKAKKEPLVRSPLDCCRPRLMREISDHKALLLLGATARSSVYGAREANDTQLMRSRGFPDAMSLEIEGKEKEYQILSTFHPAFVLRKRRFTWTFRADVRKAIAMVRGELKWARPAIHVFPSLEEIREFLIRNYDADYVAYDTETDGIEPTTARLRCIGIGTESEVMVIPWRSVEHADGYYWSADKRDIIVGWVRTFFAHDRGIVCAQNHQYDWLVMERNIPGWRLGRKVIDTAIAHHIVYSELPHDLSFLSAQFSDAPAHKVVDHTAWDNDEELHTYCAIDVAQTSRAARKLVADEALHEQGKAFRADMALSELCCRMHEIGLHINLDEQTRHYDRLTARSEELRSKIVKIALESIPSDASLGAKRLIEKYNPNSMAQTRQILFEIYGMPQIPESAGGLTATGELAVGREQLFYLIDRGLPPQIEELLQLLIDYRTAVKERSTYCTLKPMADGRIRPTWNPHVVVTGRLSSSKPNVMNVRKGLRSIYGCEPRHVLIALDKAQLELRIIAALAEDAELFDAFLAGADVHKVNAQGLFNLQSIDDVTPALRQFTKTFTYAVQYGAGIMTTWRMVRNNRDKDGCRPYTEYTMAQAEANHRMWWKARIAIKKYHERNRNFWKQYGYIADALHGRRRYFLDGGEDEANKEEQANYPIQSTAAADVNDATKRVIEAYPWGFGGDCTGVTHQNHDALMLEVPAANAVEIGKHVQALMYSEIASPSGRLMPLPVDLAIGNSWGTLKEVTA